MSDNNFYITTPIYYVNDKPHIGHAYTTILADVLSRYNRLLGADTFFATGTDEHGQKVQRAAEANGVSPIEQCDATVVRFQNLWKTLEITNDDFIRTTEERHKVIVRNVLQELFDKDLIYKDEYEGFYCVPCERFYTQKDLLDDNLCPECKRGVSEIVESNYFFRMSRYQDWLIDYIKTHPNFIQPAFRTNETLGFLQKELCDLCISRPKARMSWGIELPFDSDYVCYVWFDALLNYISVAGYGSDNAKFEKWWPASYHLIGKDILTTHTVYWPTMLKAMGVEMPETIFAHGWWLTGKDKMSKSLGNVVNPMDMANEYGVDAFRYFLMAEMSLGQDASFTEEAFVRRYNSNLANDLGNLVSRVVRMTFKQFDGILPTPSADTTDEKELQEAVKNAVSGMESAFKEMKLERGIEQVMNAVRATNKYMEKSAPWVLAKEGNRVKLGHVLYSASEALRVISSLLHPIMPEKMGELRTSLGISPDAVHPNADTPLVPGSKMSDAGPLFMRIKVDSKNDAPPKHGKKKTEKNSQISATLPEGLIAIDDFFKTQLKTAKVLEAERVEGTEKLLKLQIEVGSETRQLIAGIAQFYQPKDLIGKTVVVVANLKPAKIRGIASQGMLLVAKDGKELKLVTVDTSCPSGCPIA